MILEMFSFEEVEKKLQDKYGEDFKFKPKMSYQCDFGKHKIDIHFCKDMAFWVTKYKGEFYMNIVDEVKYKDRFVAIDLYLSLVENARETIKHLRGWEKTK
jgi:hypothetical protein